MVCGYSAFTQWKWRKEITAYSLLEEIKKDKPYRYSTEINKLMEYFKK